MKFKSVIFGSALAFIALGLQVDAKDIAKQPPVKTDSDLLIERVNATQIKKSPNDDRTYAALMLSNYLQVVVVSDPTLENSVASLAVAVGSAQDPATQPGLAHYLEHMLFLGTQRYPEPDGFMKFTQANGGMTNAFTRYDKTNYFFAISPAKFDEALDRFSDYFKSPTFDPTYADKERNAVNSEWSMQKKQDGWNIHRLTGLTANPQSPYQKFNIGNLETLSDKPNAKLQDQLKQFYQQYYSANLMRLTLVGKQSLPELKSLAQKYFSAIPNKNVIQPVVTVAGLTEKEFAKNIYYTPFQDIKHLLIDFPVKSNKDQWLFKPNEYVHALLSSEEPGTLCEQLRQKGFASGVSAEMETEAYGADGYVRIDVELTDVGVQHQDEITAAVFAYVDLLKKEGLNPNYFKELKAINAKNFLTYAKQNPIQQATNLTLAQFDFPLEHLLDAKYVYQDYKPELMTALLNQLDSRKARVWHINQKEVVDSPVKDFDGQYAIKPISNEEFLRLDALAKQQQFKLPPLNDLFSEASAPIVNNQYLKPHLVVNEKGVESFLVQPEFYREDKGSILVEINTVLATDSARNTVLAFMLTETFRKQNLTLSDRASRAGLEVVIEISKTGSLAMTVSGFTSKHPELVSALLKNFKAMDVTQKDFWEVQGAYIDIVRNKSSAQVFKQAIARMNLLTRKNHWDDSVLIAEAKKLSLKDLQKYYASVKQNSLIRIFAAGNYSEAQIQAMARDAKHLLPSQVKPNKRSVTQFQLPLMKQHWEFRDSVNLADDAILWLSFRDKKSDDERAQLALLGTLFDKALFAQLRTEEQLGYVVQGGAYPVDEVPGFFMMVQSGNTPLQKIADRMNQFRQDYPEKLAATDPEQIEQTKQAMLNNILQKPTDFYKEMGLYSNEFWQAKYDFDARDRMVRALKNVTKDDLIKIYTAFLLNPDSGSLMLQYKGTNSKEAPFVEFGKIIH